MSGRYIKQESYVDNHGIYMPVNEYVPEGSASMYRCVMTKEMFVEAYNKWIENSSNGVLAEQDDADCWCE